jgi:hypothetical protein
MAIASLVVVTGCSSSTVVGAGPGNEGGSPGVHGSADGQASPLFVRDVLAPHFVSSGQSCIYSSDPAQPFLSNGTLDTVLRDRYDAVFLVGNVLAAEADAAALLTETSWVNIQGVVVRITDSIGTQLSSYTRLASATVAPAAGSSPGFSAVGPVTVVDPNTVRGLNVSVGNVRRLVVYAQLFGTTLGGQSIETGIFEFPVDVCRACLISFTPADVNPACDAPNCLGNLALPPDAGQTVPCSIGQDFAVDCQVCKAVGVPECNPPVRCASGFDAGQGD